MNKFANLARVTTATVGTGTVTLGAAVAGYKTFADAGLADGAIITYGLREGSNSEIGIGTYNSAGPTVSRDTVIRSTNADAKINLGGNAQVFITAAAEDFDLVVNLQTGTTYTVLQTDRQKMICLTNAAAIAVTLPQATGHFGAGWSTLLKNVGSSKVTITPTTSTIGGASAITLEKGQTVKVISDGTNYYIIKAGGTGFYVQASAPTPAEVGDRWLDSDTGILYTYVPDGDSLQWVDLNSGDGFGDLLSTNNLSDVGNESTARLNLGVSPASPQGRLTLTSGTPVLTSTVSGATTIYYTPYIGQHVPLYDGMRWKMHDVGGELSQATTDATKSPAACAADSLYDLFVWSDSGTYRCTRGPAWSSATLGGSSRGTGAGTTELERVNGIWVNKVAITNGPGAQRGTYVGTIRTNGSSQVDFSFGGSASGGTNILFSVWNAYNRVRTKGASLDSGTSYTYASSTIRVHRGGTGMLTYFVVGLPEDAVDFHYTNSAAAAAGSGQYTLAIAIDQFSAFTSPFSTSNATGFAVPCPVTYSAHLGAGLHSAAGMERSDIGTTTFYPVGASQLAIEIWA